ncbi:MAG: rod shape-determining protein MreD [Chloroflexota bacterium]|nr:rod shape-determining protein MreD [Chloroflexota bacterium]MDE3100753.1 rod shape-determining protein MreD [Chloroflexota bacterium]
MRIALALVVPIVAALLQGAVASLISVGGAFPSMPVLVAASWSIAAGAREGLWWAFVAGIATDVLSAGPLGAFTVAVLPGTLIVGLGERSTAKPVPVLAGVLGVAVAALLTQSIYLGVLAFVGHPPPAPSLSLAETVGVAIYTGALALVAYPLARVVRRVTEQESPF